MDTEADQENENSGQGSMTAEDAQLALSGTRNIQEIQHDMIRVERRRGFGIASLSHCEVSTHFASLSNNRKACGGPIPL